jgi:acyl-CoA synthetase (NDP forming)
VHANILRAGYPGRLYAVNPRYHDVLGTPCFPHLAALPEVPDCVVLAVPADTTLTLAEECARLGVGGIVALASGFAEAGQRGLERQQRLRDIARGAGLAVCGPNGIGLWSVRARLAAFSPPLPGSPTPGGVALVAQSGGLLLEVLNPLLERGVGFSHILSTGNEAATSLEAFLGHLLEQPEVEMAVAIVESFKEPARLRPVLARAAALRKPVIVLKVGRSPAGQRAAASHTGSLAQDDAVIDAVLRSAGATRVNSTEHLVETVVLFGRRAWPTRSEVVLVSTSGGRCSLLGDLASRVPLTLADFAAPTVARLGELLPDFGSPNNPLDPTGIVFDREGIYAPMLAALADDPGVGLVGVYQVTRNINARGADEQRTHRSVGLAAEVVDAARSSTAPIVAFTSTTGGVVDPQVVEALDHGQVPLLLGLESALAAIGSAVDYAAFLRRSASSVPSSVAAGPTAAALAEADAATGTPADSSGLDAAAGVDVAAWRAALGRDGSLSEHDAKRLLAAAGLPVIDGKLAHTPEQAVALAERLGYPVALKASGAHIAHKTERGLVRLNLTSATEVRAHATDLQALATQPRLSERSATAHQAPPDGPSAAANPAAHDDPSAAANPAAHDDPAAAANRAALQGAAQDDGPTAILVERMASPGVELILGARQTEFGPVVLCGAGGVLAELVADTRLALAPLDAQAAEALLLQTRAGRLLQGFRGRPLLDLAAATHVLVRLSELIADLSGVVDEIDLNPLIVHDHGAVVVDALVRGRSTTSGDDR